MRTKVIFHFLLLLLMLTPAASLCAKNNTGRIAYLRLTNGFWQVWVMDEYGVKHRQLTKTPVDKLHMAWKFDNSEILYHTNQGKTFIITLASGKLRQILTDLKLIDADWHPNGKQISYSLEPKDLQNGKTTLWISDLNGYKKRLVAGGTTAHALAPEWYKNGKEMVFRQCVQINNMEVKHDFWKKTVDNKTILPVMGDTEVRKFDQSVSESGLLVYTSMKSGFFELWTLPISSRSAKQLTHMKGCAANPRWSPDSKVVVFDYEDESGRSIYRIEQTGEHLKQLTPKGILARKPYWSN